MNKSKSHERLALLIAFIMLLTIVNIPVMGYASTNKVLKYKTSNNFYFSYSNSESQTIPFEEIMYAENGCFTVYVSGDISKIKDVAWHSGDTSIVEVEKSDIQDGENAGAAATVITKGVGLTTITATGGNESISMYINVVNNVNDAVTIEYANATDEDYLDGVVFLTPDQERTFTTRHNNVDTEVTWLIPDNGSVDMTDNTLKGIKVTDESQYICAIPTDKSIGSYQFEASVIEEESEQDYYTIANCNPTSIGKKVALEVHNGKDDTKYDGDVVWSTANPDVVSIDANGTATAHKDGIVKIKATIGDIYVMENLLVGDNYIAYDFENRLGIGTMDEEYRLEGKGDSVDISKDIYLTEYNQETQKSELVDPSKYKLKFDTDYPEILDLTTKGVIISKVNDDTVDVNVSATYKGQLYDCVANIYINDDITIDGLTYSLDKDLKEAILRFANSDWRNGVIPKTIDAKGLTYKVTLIDANAFDMNEEIMNIVIPEGIRGIGDYAFYMCPNLKNVTLPDSLKEIGDMAFGYLDGETINKGLTIHCDINNAVGVGYAKSKGLKTCFPINKYTLSLDKTAYTYNGKSCIPAITLKAENITLKNNEDYSVKYTSNVNAGTAKAIITGKGKYEGIINKTFAIKKANQTISAKTYTKTYGDKRFSLGAKAKSKLTYKSNAPSVAAVAGNGQVTIKGPGKATITICAASTNNYNSAFKSITVTVNPKRASISKLKAGKGSLKATWKRDSKATGYQIIVAKDKNFMKGKKIVTITKNKNTSKTFKKLSRKQTYHVKVRAYKTVGKYKVYGKYSTIKKVKVK